MAMTILLWSILCFLVNAVVTSGDSHGSFEGECSTASGCDYEKQENLLLQQMQPKSNSPITLAFLLCDQEQAGSGEFNANLTLQIRQLIVSLKSISLAEKYDGNTAGEGTRQRSLDLKLVVNKKEIFDHVENTVGKWDPKFRKFLKLNYVPAVYPKGYEWMDKEFKPCAATRLFLDRILMGTDSVIYADTDTLFLKSVQHLWADFDKFKEETVAAMTPELLPKRGQRIKKYNSDSYNSGIMLMNLTRMRAIEWTERLGMISKLFLKEAEFGDEDILIQYFKHFPNQLHKLPCQWNFSPRNCKFARECTDHGILGVYSLSRNYLEGQSETGFFQKLFTAYENLDLAKKFALTDFTQQLKNQTFECTKSSSSCDESPEFRQFIINSIERFELIETSTTEIVFDNFEERRNLLAASFPPPIPSEVPETTHSQEMETNACINVCLIYCDPPQKRGKIASMTKQFNETVVLLKSMVLLEKISPNPKCINAIILGDDVEAFNGLVSRIMESWNSEYTKLLQFNFVPFTYSKDFAWMKKIFRRCSALRLNYADLLPNYDAVMHLDTDLIFIRPVSELWAEFDNFPEETIMKIAPELGTNRSDQASKKYYWPTKYQGGVMLMNLTRMRSIGFPARTNMIATFFRKELKLPTQVTLTIYFHHFPEQISLLDCGWSFLHLYCRKETHPPCSSIFVTHGANRTFAPSSIEPVYINIFQHYQAIEMQNPVATSLLQNLTKNLEIEFDITAENVSPCSSSTFRRNFMESLKSNTVTGISSKFKKNM